MYKFQQLVTVVHEELYESLMQRDVHRQAAATSDRLQQHSRAKPKTKNEQVSQYLASTCRILTSDTKCKAQWFGKVQPDYFNI